MSPPAPTSSAPNTVSGFFSNLFGGGSSRRLRSPANRQVTTASTTPAAGDIELERHDLGRQTRPLQRRYPDAAASRRRQRREAGAVLRPSGKYKVHIAAVRSRAEAEALAQKLAAQHGAALKSRTPAVDEAVIGSMGTFYRVRVGSYANAEEPRGVCNTLRTSGFDCLVVTN